MENRKMDFFIPMVPPRTTHQQKKLRVKPGGGVRIYEPSRLKDARDKLTGHLWEYKPMVPFQGAVSCSVTWLFPTSSRKKRGTWKITRPDCHNLNKLLFDVMQSLHFWEDDAQVVHEETMKMWHTEPGIKIKIVSVDDL